MQAIAAFRRRAPSRLLLCGKMMNPPHASSSSRRYRRAPGTRRDVSVLGIDPYQWRVAAAREHVLGCPETRNLGSASSGPLCVDQLGSHAIAVEK